ncbi:MAG: LysR family transcriptional regulator [Pseudomonadota bacterium]
MNITAIQTFLAVYRLGNLNRAADELNITQSAVTARLDALENTLGTPLLNRSRKGATLTKAGYGFLEQADLILRTWQSAKARLSLPTGITQLFSFVCEPSLWTGRGRDMLHDWRVSNRDIAFEVWNASLREAGEWLSSGMSDAALLTAPLTGPEIAHRVIDHEKIVQVSTKARDVMTWDPHYVFVDYGHAFRTWHSETWPGDDLARMAFSDPDWALDHLLSEGGSAYLPASVIDRLVRERRLFPVENAAHFERQIVMNWRTASAAQFPWFPARA